MSQPVARRRRALGPRRTFLIVALVLAAALVAMIGYLLLSSSQPATKRLGGPVAGLEPLAVLIGPGRGSKPLFDRPLDAAWGKDGRIYVADSGNNRIVVFSADGTFIREFGSFGVAKPAPGAKATWHPGDLNFPIGIDADAAGNVYVADFYNDSVSVYDPNGKFQFRFPDPAKPVGKGSSGQGGGGIAVTDVEVAGDKVYATDTWQVTVFSKEGRLLRQFGKPGTGRGDMDHPNGVAAAKDGTIYVADSNNNRLSAYTPSGAPLWELGSPIVDLAKKVDRPLNIPRDVTVLANGDVLVVDALDQSLSRVSSAGKLLARYGARGTDPGALNFPNSVDAKGDRVLVADKENNRVQVLALVGGR